LPIQNNSFLYSNNFNHINNKKTFDISNNLTGTNDNSISEQINVSTLVNFNKTFKISESNKEINTEFMTSLTELWNYYENLYKIGETQTIAAFQTKIFSGTLLQITEIAIDEEIQPDSDSMWKCFQNNFVLPEIHVNGAKTFALIDTGASCSVMSIKFSQTESVESLKLVFKSNARTIKLADNKEVQTKGYFENVPITLNNQETLVNTHLMNNLSYDLILGRDWCNANGVVIDFNKKKIYLLRTKAEKYDILNHIEDNNSEYIISPTEYAQLTHKVIIKPYHETPVLVRSPQNDCSTLFVKSYEPVVDRFGIFTTKGIVHFQNNLAHIVIANLTSKEVFLPVGTIVARLESVNEDDFEILKWSDCNISNKSRKFKSRCLKKRLKTQHIKHKTRKETIQSQSFNNLVSNNKYSKILTRKYLFPQNLTKINSKLTTSKPLPKSKQSLVVNATGRLLNIIDVASNKFDKLYDKSKTDSDSKENDGIKTTNQLDEVKIDENNLTKDQLKQVRNLLKKKSQVFAKKNEPPSKAINVSHSIDTGNHPPINVPKYRTSHKERPIINEHIKEMLKNRVIEPSKSPWAFPIVLVPKKDGSIRFCVDYRRLNQITVKDSYALPRIDDALASLSGNKFFSSLDVFAGYWQIPMNEADKDKTAFITDSGLYRFNVMAFGLTNAPATFQRYMDAVLSGLKWNILLVYIDDILCYSKTFEDHLRDLEVIFDRLIEANMQLKPSKCHLFQNELVYLGHLVSADGI
jgi:hypothetical protein